MEKKRYKDEVYIKSLRDGTFGFHGRPLLWLWRFSSRQKKVQVGIKSRTDCNDGINWRDVFFDANKPLVVDIGSGMGTCILGLSSIRSTGHEELRIQWSECNYAGVDLNQNFINFANGIASRGPTSRKGRVRFFCCSADDFLLKLQTYPGMIELMMVNFPSPYRLEAGERGNLQLSSVENFMVTNKMFEIIGVLAGKQARGSYFLFQTKCEDVAVYLKNKCLSNGMEGIPAKEAVEDIDMIYSRNKDVPKRIIELLRIDPHSERAEGYLFWGRPILPPCCLPETEVQCLIDQKVVHRCLFRCKK